MSPRILVVEDNPTNLALMSYLLRAYGYDVATAENGAEAVRTIADVRPDLVLMDLHMPVMDGFEAARRIRADRAFDHVPLIAVTAYAMVGDRDRVLASGFDGYLPKPIVPEAFGAEIAAFLASPPRAGLTAAAPGRGDILIVGGEPSSQAAMAERLAAVGYRVTTCRTVAESAQCASHARPHVVLVATPGGHTYELIRVGASGGSLRGMPFAFSDGAVASGDGTLGRATFISGSATSEELMAAIAAADGALAQKE